MSERRRGDLREAALDLALDVNAINLSYEAIAAHAGVSVDEVRQLCPDESAIISCILRPLAETVDNTLRELPIHPNPTPAQQRETLDALLSASLRYPRQQAFVLRLLSSSSHHPSSRKADQFAYQAGIRLLGVDYDTDPDSMSRVYFVTEMLACAVSTHRHDLASQRSRDVLLDSLVAALNPSTMGPTGRSVGRRWTDSSLDGSGSERSH